MAKRQIINIDHEKCDGCGQCIPDCPEGALRIIDNKAHLISDIFCDGLGACIGTCPQGAISTIEREAEEYDEKVTMENIIKAGPNVIKAHLKHLKDHAQTKYYNIAVEVLKEKDIEVPDMEDDLPCGCPGTEMRVLETSKNGEVGEGDRASALRQWPVQIHLLHPKAPFFDNSHLLLLADCVAAANPNLHSQLIHGKTVAMGCPKLDDAEAYIEKLSEIIKQNRIKSITVATMEVPCCGGMVRIAEEAISRSGKDAPLIKEMVSMKGELM
ncbi:MAG: 4Fe-4S binding protein [Candidatus Thermoplasmatota archaeon]|nr:4Fe-4S binding protein [Candidatus Thermoplasmatota archaeon]